MTAARERVLVTVKTYPTLSKRYGETVCTAGVRPDGTWVRIYPVPFRRLNAEEQYKKFDWIDCRLERNTRDPRPETFRARDFKELVRVDHMGTEDAWRDRRQLLLRTARVFTNLDALIAEAKGDPRTSLAVFRPTRMIDFVWESEEREWDATRLREVRERASQRELFEDDAWRETFDVIPKLPYSFSYRFEDDRGRISELQVLDWETGALFWNCVRRGNGDEKAALAKVREKYIDAFTKSDLHLFLGTTEQYHFVAPNPFVIVGVLPIPHEQQLGLIT